MNHEILEYEFQTSFLREYDISKSDEIVKLEDLFIYSHSLKSIKLYIV